MRIGLRTVKTVISATLAMLIAEKIGLLYPTSAGIIAVLSVSNTKKTSVFTGFYRLLSLVLATAIAIVCFQLLGFSAVAFGVYLLLFIPAAVTLKLSDGIVVSSVLVTHYLVERDVSWQIIGNELLLMCLGVGLALLVNLYMPDTEKRLQQDQRDIEATFRQLLGAMAHYLNQDMKNQQLPQQCSSLKHKIEMGEQWAKKHAENRLWSANTYYIEYFSMRNMQSTILKDMLELLEEITVDPQHVAAIQRLLDFTEETFAEENDGVDILMRIAEVFKEYRQKPLPTTRSEFENRAQLFQFLQLFRAFVEIKADFVRLQVEKNLSE
ncbi:aromatic acid exporter family protein [Enterococcus faecalis]